MTEKNLSESYPWYETHQKWLLDQADGCRADLREVDLSGADLSGADLRWVNLRGVNLRLANLSGANLSGADLSGADLRLANLRGAVLCDCNLDGAVVMYRGASVRVTFTPIQEAMVETPDK